ncbi:MAG: phosphatase PAP2 family protein [Bdellovibrionota bacterium]|nr:phosphatase PAP2 family protein [Bdellovibrionota bacterium]
MVKSRNGLTPKLFKKTIHLIILSAILCSQSNLLCKEKLNQKKQDSKDFQLHKINDDYSFSFEKPKFWDFITLTPTTFKTFYKESVSPEGLKGLAWITAWTALTYYYDRELLNGAQLIGRKVGLGNDNHTRSMIKVGKLNIFRGPTDIGSSMYFIGDGWTHMAITFSYILYGSFKNNYRAMSTGSNLLHGIFFSTILNQFLKRTTGRESPYRASNKRGKWRFFPNQNKYNKDISKYDAFPSGHLATSTVTLTVLLENYPEHRYWLLPVGTGLLTLLSYQMMNNGVHWASDYPLALGMGYLIGKISANYGKKVIKTRGKNQGFWDNIEVKPIFSKGGTMGLYLNKTF